jgi:hypothetical protein
MLLEVRLTRAENGSGTIQLDTALAGVNGIALERDVGHGWF